jgi:hypothetical protein
MKKAVNFVALVAVSLVLVAQYSSFVQARLIGTNPLGVNADVWCTGGRIRGNTTLSDMEMCQDASNNLVPTTTLRGSIGLSTEAWVSVNASQIIPTDTSSSRLHLPVISTTTGITLAVTQGDLYAMQDASGKIYTTCFASGTVTNGLVLSSAPATACR